MTSNPLDLDAIQARLDAATKGPWGTYRDLAGVYTIQARPRTTIRHGHEHDGDIATLAASRSDAESYTNAHFITRAPQDVAALVAEVRRLNAELATARSETFREAADIVHKTTAPADWNGDAVSNWNTATNIAEHKLRQHVATVLPPRRTLTELEHDRAWHAIEGAAGEEGADPGTVLNAVLRALDLNPPTAPARSAAV